MEKIHVGKKFEKILFGKIQIGKKFGEIHIEKIQFGKIQIEKYKLKNTVKRRWCSAIGQAIMCQNGSLSTQFKKSRQLSHTNITFETII